jgi:asparagine synthase (glutamine-hydrolysing)
MTDATGRWTISFNGEIYNYRALRSELEGLGCVFLTQSDTEVLMNALAHWGEAAFPKIRGMYAFALWDSTNNELWLVRDPYGIKPLYYAFDRGILWFASQARALAECAPINSSRDAAGLTGFYLWGHVPEPFTWWAGVTALPAGHLLRVRRGSPFPRPLAHTRIEDVYLNRSARPLDSVELRELLLESVRHHLVSDVPVGIFLSAGVDSSVIAALATELGAAVQTVTLAFDEFAGTQDDEAPLAEDLARQLGSQHKTVRITRDEFEAAVDDFFQAMDQPSIDGLNTYMVSRAAGGLGLKVALSGIGGDELFGGYPSFTQIPKLLAWRRRLPGVAALAAMARPLFPLIPNLPPKVSGIFAHPMGITEAYFLRRALHLEEELEALIDHSWFTEGLDRLNTTGSLVSTMERLKGSGASMHSQIAALESCWYMRNQLLRDTDWSSMAHGLEVRVPFVSASLLADLGPSISSRQPPNKRDLAGTSPMLPASLALRRKTGFTTPARSWIAARSGKHGRGMRGWADTVHRRFRSLPDTPPTLLA